MNSSDRPSGDALRASRAGEALVLASNNIRRPYEAPRIETGDAFERVQLASGCNFADPLEGCDPVC